MSQQPTVPQSVTGNGGAALPTDDAQARWQAEQNNQLQNQQSQQPSPQAQVAKVTQYGWSTDPNQDYNTNTLKVGNRDNPLTPHAAALTDAEAKALNAKPGDVLDVGGSKYYYADRAPESDARVDLYAPTGLNKNVPDNAPVRDLGGGSTELKGADLSNVGEANVQQFLNNGQASSVAAPQAAAPSMIPASFRPAQQTPIDSARASDNSNGIAFINLLKRLNFGAGQNPFASINTNQST